jgi:hypothetical protein
MEVTVIPARNPPCLVFYRPSEYVKDVTYLMSSKEEENKSPTDTTSALNVEPLWSLAAALNGSTIEATTVKCSKCTTMTYHEWVSIQPAPLFHTDDVLDVVSRRKRLTLCTVCGTLKLIT